MTSLTIANLHLLAPILIVLGGGVFGVLIEAFVPRSARWTTQVIYSVAIIAAAATALAAVWGADPTPLAGGELYSEAHALKAQAIILIVALLALLVMADRTELGDSAFAAQPSDRPGSREEELSVRAGVARSEIFPLLLLSTGGMLVFPMSASLLTLFVALEVFSLPLYIMCATARRRRLLSQESALKYFALGAFGSTFLLMGIALFYGATGTINLVEFTQRLMSTQLTSLANPNLTMLLGALALILIGLLFKVGAAPFHAWTPDVYQGAPTPVTGFMAAGVKVAAFMAMVRLWLTAGAFLAADLYWFLVAVIVLTIVIGTFVGLVQDDIKRMLAYSSIAHAGFILIAFVVTTASVPTVAQISYRAILFYLLAYSIATIGAFAAMTLVRETDINGTVLGEANRIAQWNGLGRTNPWLASAMLIFLLSFAGIPLTGGFVAKFLIFGAGIAGGAWPLVVVAIIASAITAYYYFRLAVAMFFKEPQAATEKVSSQGLASAVVIFCAIATILLGVVPGAALAVLG